MIAIFEGVEASGKTTLINELMKWRPWFINCKRTSRSWWQQHESGDDPMPEPWDLNEAFFYDWRFFLEFIGNDSQGFGKATFLCDRSFITHQIFNTTLYKELHTDKHQAFFEAYEKKLAALPHVVFLCKRDVEPDFVDNFCGDVNIDVSKRNEMIAAYDEWRKNSPLHIVEIDNNASLQDNVLKCLAELGA